MERSEIRVTIADSAPDFASLHPGYEAPYLATTTTGVPTCTR